MTNRDRWLVVAFFVFIGMCGAVLGMLTGINAKLARMIELLANQ
jgi:hypothetical protein